MYKMGMIARNLTEILKLPMTYFNHKITALLMFLPEIPRDFAIRSKF